MVNVISILLLTVLQFVLKSVSADVTTSGVNAFLEPRAMTPVKFISRMKNAKPPQFRCCYQDMCNQRRLCIHSSRTMKDSCGRTFSVSAVCSLTLIKAQNEKGALAPQPRRECCYEDRCGPKRKVCKHAGGTLRESCGGVYRVKQTCALKRVGKSTSSKSVRQWCCYSDKCNGELVCQAAGKVLRDKCARKWLVSQTCRIRSTGNAKKKCCFQDTCNRSRRCVRPGREITDGCGQKLKFSSKCKQSILGKTPKKSPDPKPILPPPPSASPISQLCCFIDSCGQGQICAPRGGILTNSCSVQYRVDEGCNAGFIIPSPRPSNPPSPPPKPAPSTQPNVPNVCCYSDACNRKRICAQRGGLLVDSCPVRYRVSHECKLTREGTGNVPNQSSICCYSDACSHKRICAHRGGVLVDSCPVRYRVSHDCKLTKEGHVAVQNPTPRKCCYVDACNKHHICAHAGGFLVDSCPVTYHVSAHCKLTKAGH